MKSNKEVFEHQLQDLFGAESKTEQDKILHIFALYTYQNNVEADRMLEIFSLLGMESFMRLVTHLDGETIKLPSKNALKDSIIFCLCYYYKENKGMSWQEIQAVIPFEFSSMSYSIKIKNLNKYVHKQIMDMFKDLDEEQSDE